MKVKRDIASVQKGLKIRKNETYLQDYIYKQTT